jgi:signal transduction histidine kinase
VPTLENIDLGSWLREHLASWSGHVRVADLRLECSSEGPLWVHSQAPLLGQLLDILLENACKYSEPGTAVRVLVRGEEASAWLAVQDEGCGIAPEDVPHVFEPFYRSPRVRGQALGGVGLGLALARRIASVLGGSLTVVSELGRGSCFTLRLPT